MKLKLGVILLIVGLAMAIYGLVAALASIGSVYSQALTDPMAQRGPDVDPKAVSSSALSSAVVGLIGAVIASVGGWLASVGFFRRKKARERAQRGST
jgi:hypothetical protein